MSDTIDQARLTDLAGALLDAARRAGAEAADVVAVSGVSLSASVRHGEAEEIERSEGNELGLRVLVGRRQACVSSNDTRPETFAALAERAVDMARAAPEDPYAGLADPALLARRFPDLDLNDAAPCDAEGLKARALAAEEAMLAVPGVTNSGGADASWGLGGLVLVTSDGFSGAYLGSRRSVSAMAVSGEGTGMERDYDFSSATHEADLESAEAIGASAGERAARRTGPRKIETRRAAVVYDPRAAASLLGHFAGAANGASVARGASFLSDMTGKRVFREGVAIFDDPLRARGLASRPFDGEGVATARTDLVANGILRSWVLDSATARELGLATTGHAARGAGAPPSPATSNLALAPGALSPQALMAGLGEGFYVTDLMGSGANLVTGDYSRGASGFWFENGEIAYPVSEVTIAGELADMFARLVPADDLVWRRAVNAPTVAIEGLTIAGR